MVDSKNTIRFYDALDPHLFSCQLCGPRSIAVLLLILIEQKVFVTASDKCMGVHPLALVTFQRPITTITVRI